MSSYFAVLLFGNKNITCILFSKTHGAASYFAEKKIVYDGFSEKDFINPEDVFLKTERLVKSVEEEHGATVKTVYCALPSVFFRYGITEKDVAIVGGTVTNKDVQNLLDSCAVGLPGYFAVEKLPLFYKSFNNPVMTDPVGEMAERLYVTASCGYLNSRVKELLDNCAKKLRKEFVLNSYATLAAKRLEYDFLQGVRRIVILFCGGTTDVVLCEGGVPVEVRTVPWGEDSVRAGIKELLHVDDYVCNLLMKRLNLNLAFEKGDFYRIFGKEYSVAEVNSFVTEAVDFFAKEVKKNVGLLPRDDGAVYLTGSAFCANRGVKELFEDELGKDVYVAESHEANMDGCENYILSAYAVLDKNNDNQSGGLIQKIFRRK